MATTEPTKPTAPAPTVKVTVEDKPANPTPESDAKAALPARKAAEKAAAAAHAKLEEDGLIVPQIGLTSYESERAKLGASPEEVADATK